MSNQNSSSQFLLYDKGKRVLESVSSYDQLLVARRYAQAVILELKKFHKSKFSSEAVESLVSIYNAKASMWAYENLTLMDDQMQ